MSYSAIGSALVPKIIIKVKMRILNSTIGNTSGAQCSHVKGNNAHVDLEPAQEVKAGFFLSVQSFFELWVLLKMKWTGLENGTENEMEN